MFKAFSNVRVENGCDVNEPMNRFGIASLKWTVRKNPFVEMSRTSSTQSGAQRVCVCVCVCVCVSEDGERYPDSKVMMSW